MKPFLSAASLLWVSSLPLLGAPVVHATPLSVTESVDFSSAGFVDVGTLDVGLNTISGSVAGAPGSGDFEDTFSVTLLPGLIISLAQVVITNFASDTLLVTPGVLIEPLNGVTAISQNGTVNLTANAPYATSGTVKVDFQAMDPTVGFSPERNNRYTYSLAYTVAPVPEPGMLPVLGAGAAALMLRRLRRR